MRDMPAREERMKLLLEIPFHRTEIHSTTLNIHFQTVFEGKR